MFAAVILEMYCHISPIALRCASSARLVQRLLQVLKHVGPETIITHEVSAQTAGNLIGQRDFLSVRHSCKHKSSLYLGGAAIQLESFPPQAGFVR